MRIIESYDWSMSEDLNEAETAFRTLWGQYRHLKPEKPHDTEVYAEMFHRASVIAADVFPKELFQDMLEERDFFQSTNDIELYRHLRYLPCNWHSHDFLEVICVVEGSCTNYISEQTQELNEGDICIVAPNIRHAVSAFSDGSIVYNILIRVSTFETVFFSVLKDDNILSRFFRRMLYQAKTTPYLLVHAGMDQSLFNFVGYAYDEATHDYAYKKQMINSIVTAFFTMLLRNHGTEVIAPELASLDRNQNVVSLLLYLQEHYKTTSLPDTAAIFNYSERQIQRLVTGATGMGFSANILKLKMEEAERLLAYSDLPVAEIAEGLGYMDPRNFRQTFRKHFGMNPREYRETMRT